MALRSAPVRLLTLTVVAVAALALGCGGGSDGEDTVEAGALLTRSGSITRSASPFSFVQTLRAETADGKFLEQRTEGVYDRTADRSSLIVVSNGEATTVFTAATTVELGSVLNIVIDGSNVYLRLDFAGIDDLSQWTPLDAGPNSPTTEGTVSMLGAALVADVTSATLVDDDGQDSVGGVAVTHYRVPADSAEVAIYLPTETLDLLLEGGLRRDSVRARTTVDYWLDVEGRIRRISIDHQPLIDELTAGWFEAGAAVTSLRHTFEITQFGDVMVRVPSPSEIDSGTGSDPES